MTCDYRKIEYLKDLLFELTKKEIKIRYKNSYLGYLWSIMNPLSLAIVFYLAFKLIMKVKIESYALFLIVGLFPWQLFGNSVNSSAVVFISNASLLKKTVFPREMIVYSLILNELFHFLLSIPVIILFLLIYGRAPSVSWIVGLPVLVTLQFVLVSGVSLAVASANLFFRDLERLVAILTNLLFYLTPIIYSMSMIPAKYHAFIMLNPLSPFILAYKELFLEGSLNLLYFAASFLWSVVIFVSGYLIYNRFKWKLSEVV